MTFFGLILGISTFALIIILFVLVMFGSHKRKKAKNRFELLLKEGNHYEALKLLHVVFDLTPVDDNDRKSNLWVIDQAEYCLKKLNCQNEDLIQQHTRVYIEKKHGFRISIKI
jgi:hypothetical protein